MNWQSARKKLAPGWELMKADGINPEELLGNSSAAAPRAGKNASRVRRNINSSMLTVKLKPGPVRAVHRSQSLRRWQKVNLRRFPDLITEAGCRCLWARPASLLKLVGSTASYLTTLPFHKTTNSLQTVTQHQQSRLIRRKRYLRYNQVQRRLILNHPRRSAPGALTARVGIYLPLLAILLFPAINPIFE